MLRYALIFLIIAVTAGVLGFSGIAAGLVEMARILFVVFIALFIFATIMHFFKLGKSPTA